MGTLRPALPSPVLMLVTDRLRLKGREHSGDEVLDDIVRDAVLGGVNVVQLREKDLATNELIALGLHVRDAIAGRALFFVNGDLAAARALGADGIHLPASGPSPRQARDDLGDRVLISVAAHTIVEAQTAERAGADAIVVGSVFATNSHPGVQTLGLHGIESVATAVDVPIIAIGGITPDNASACIDAGASGVAVISPIHDAPDPRQGARTLHAALTSDERPATTQPTQ
jgi:thiamine-phosphate pyrophosphorylase